MADMYMRNIRDWRDATLMLSFEEKGYYDEILNLIYIYDDCLPDNDEMICRAMPVNKKMHHRLKSKLIKAGLITIQNGFYFNRRASHEVAKINELSARNKEKALKRWAKSLKKKDNGHTGASSGQVSEIFLEQADEVLKVNVNSESDLLNQKSRKKRLKNASGTRTTTKHIKCAIDDVFDPDGSLPEEYRKYAESGGLSNCDRVFCDWANWWVSEDGRKAGADGWFATWKTRVRKDVDRQMAAGKNNAGQSWNRGATTTDGARLALNRRRARGRKI